VIGDRARLRLVVLARLRDVRVGGRRYADACVCCGQSPRGLRWRFMHKGCLFWGAECGTDAGCDVYLVCVPCGDRLDGIERGKGVK
jgi:hypothetical protein